MPGSAGIRGGVDGEDDDGAVVAHDVAFGGDITGFADLVGGDVEDAALVDGLGGKDLGGAGEVLAGAVGIVLIRIMVCHALQYTKAMAGGV